jgi:ribosomal protein S21
MGVRIVVREGEPIASALNRLRRAAFFAQQRPWYKGSRSFYEKPSRLRHKRGYVDRLKNMGGGLYKVLYMNCGVGRQLGRTEQLMGVFGCGTGQNRWRGLKRRSPQEPSPPTDDQPPE